MAQGEVLTIREVADLLKVGEKKAYELAQKGELPAFKVGGQWRVRTADIHAWMEEQVQGRQSGKPKP